MLHVRSTAHGPVVESRVLYERELDDLNERLRYDSDDHIRTSRREGRIRTKGHKADLARKKLTIQKVASFWKRAC